MVGYCGRCGKELPEGAAFCPSCGAAAETKGDGGRRRTESYEGSVHKCPNCGEQLGSFVTICPSCGYELRSVSPASRVAELADRLAAAETNEQKDELIRTFYIPNTREDIYEFFILATSNIEAGDDDADAWYAKLDQAYKKAELVLGEGPELERLKSLYSKSGRTRLLKKSATAMLRSRGVQCAALFLAGLALEVIGGFCGSASGDPDSPFYMVGMLGFFPIMGAFLLFLASISGEKN